MVRNEGTIDRNLPLWGLLGLVTGLVGFCPLYRLLGIAMSRHDEPPSAEVRP